MAERIPIIDLFAGPGGLGEGFASFTDHGRARFRVALSIEMNPAAHKTLELRSFFRQFEVANVPEAYYRHLQGKVSRDELFEMYPVESASAKTEAWNAELGKVDPLDVDARIARGLAGAPIWVLCGGPPCQAYSVIGRSRNGGIREKDHRIYLYREYLRILAAHRPPIFILENVKGLLSSRLGDRGIFKNMMADLSRPDEAVGSFSSEPARYHIYSLAVPPRTMTFDGPEFDARDFTIKCEDYGIPQARHRLILLGVRSDLDYLEIPTLAPATHQTAVTEVLKGLPRLRSGLTRTQDGGEEWKQAIRSIINSGMLEGIPACKQPDLMSKITSSLESLSIPRNNRGGEFVSCAPGVAYRPDWFLDDRIGGICNHATRPHMKEDLFRYFFAACYARIWGRSPDLGDYPPGLLPRHRNVLDKSKEKYFDDRFRVQLAHKPSSTVVSHIAKDGHYYIHYDETQCRSLTVREAARLQTFPDNYLFCGNRTEQYTQVGNAVPPLLAVKIAEVVSGILSHLPSPPNGPAARSNVRRTGSNNRSRELVTC